MGFAIRLNTCKMGSFWSYYSSSWKIKHSKIYKWKLNPQCWHIKILIYVLTIYISVIILSSIFSILSFKRVFQNCLPRIASIHWLYFFPFPLKMETLKYKFFILLLHWEFLYNVHIFVKVDREISSIFPEI